jgi:formate dehydrogenase subunit gamma
MTASPPPSDVTDAQAGVLPVLRRLQAENGGLVPDEALPAIAERFGLSRFEARALAIFAESFRPDGGRHMLGVCRGRCCSARGGRELGDAIAERLGLAWWGETADGRLELEPAYCLGLCDNGPAARVDDELIARLDRIGVAALLAELGVTAP